jgi:hypothetical protein
MQFWFFSRLRTGSSDSEVTTAWHFSIILKYVLPVLAAALAEALREMLYRRPDIDAIDDKQTIGQCASAPQARLKPAT